MEKLMIKELMKLIPDSSWVRVFRVISNNGEIDILNSRIEDMYIGKAAYIFDNLLECKIVFMNPDNISRRLYPDIFGTGHDFIDEICVLSICIKE